MPIGLSTSQTVLMVALLLAASALAQNAQDDADPGPIMTAPLVNDIGSTSNVSVLVSYQDCFLKWLIYFGLKEATEEQRQCCRSITNCDCFQMLCNQSANDPLCTNPPHNPCILQCANVNMTKTMCFALPKDPMAPTDDPHSTRLWILLVAVFIIAITSVGLCCAYQKKFRRDQESKPSNTIRSRSTNRKWSDKSGANFGQAALCKRNFS